MNLSSGRHHLSWLHALCNSATPPNNLNDSGFLGLQSSLKKMGGRSSVTRGLFCARTLGAHWPVLAELTVAGCQVRFGPPEGLVEAMAPQLSLERGPRAAGLRPQV